MDTPTLFSRSRLGGSRAVVAAAAAARQSGRAGALALVVETQGSTYRKPGALAWLGADGARQGVISGGCLEPELERVAELALRGETAQTVVFDTQGDEDLLFGSGSGCRGLMSVLVLPLRANEPVDVPAWLQRAASEGVPLRVALRWSPEPAVLALGLREECVGLAEGTTTHVVAVPPPPRVLLLGAGPEAPPLARIARELGWLVDVADHRSGLAQATRLDGADHVLVARPAAALTARVGNRLDAVLCMTHSAGADLEALRALAGTTVPYIGLLGPPARRDELLAQLAASEHDALQGRLHAPVGLVLGGEGPESIALSIAAGLQRHFTAA